MQMRSVCDVMLSILVWSVEGNGLDSSFAQNMEVLYNTSLLNPGHTITQTGLIFQLI